MSFELFCRCWNPNQVVEVNYMMTRLVGCHFHLQGIFPTQGSTWVSCIASRFFTIWANREVHSLHLTQFQDWPQGNGNKPALELMINCISNNKGDTDQIYFKMIVGASCATLQVTCPLLSPVHSWLARSWFFGALVLYLPRTAGFLNKAVFNFTEHLSLSVGFLSSEQLKLEFSNKIKHFTTEYLSF